VPAREPAPPVDGPPRAVLAAAFLFNLGQGVLRPSLPLFMQTVFAANYRMVTLIPVVFGAGKWLATLPTGYLQDRLGRTRLMVAGLLVIAGCDLASTAITVYGPFLFVRGVGGAGWAMFGTVATSLVIDTPAAERRGRAVSLLLTIESAGLLLGTAGGGWLYQRAGTTSPFLFEAACMVVAAIAVAWRPVASVKSASMPSASASTPSAAPLDRPTLAQVLRVPGVVLITVVNATLIAIQTGVLVFLFPLYLAERGGLRPDAVGYCLSLGVAGRLLTLWLGGSLSDRYGRPAVLIPGLAAYAIVLAAVASTTSPLLLALLSFAIGAGAGFVASLPTAIVGDRVPPETRGIAVGWLRSVTDAGMLLGPLAMGALADAAGLAAPFLCAAILLFVLATACRGLRATAVATT
jgi:MFS family permease